MSNSKRSRRNFTTEQKVALMRRHLVDKEPVSKICEEEKLQPSLFYQWLRQAFDNLAGALAPEAADEASKREKEQAARIRELETKLVKKDNVIAEVTEELVRTKKELGEP
jgi:transposase-like protein